MKEGFEKSYRNYLAKAQKNGHTPRSKQEVMSVVRRIEQNELLPSPQVTDAIPQHHLERNEKGRADLRSAGHSASDRPILQLEVLAALCGSQGSSGSYGTDQQPIFK